MSTSGGVGGRGPRGPLLPDFTYFLERDIDGSNQGDPFERIGERTARRTWGASKLSHSCRVSTRPVQFPTGAFFARDSEKETETRDADYAKFSQVREHEFDPEDNPLNSSLVPTPAWRNGRRRGLKILRGVTPVWVRIPPPVMTYVELGSGTGIAFRCTCTGVTLD